MAKKKIHVGWAMMRLNKAGNWEMVITRQMKSMLIHSYQNIWSGDFGDYYRVRRSCKLKVKKMYVTM